MKTFLPADILLPKGDFERWSVIACDQYTSDGAYWARADQLVGDAPSALRVTLPEYYLEEGDVSERIETVNRTMGQYMASDMLCCLPKSFVYVERTVTGGKVRRGLVGVFDLEDYDFNVGSTSLIRATEGTVLSRIPPRVKIREHAPMELPHIMVLIDDRQKTVIEPLAQEKGELLYDFDLMQNGGHIRGWKVSAEAAEGISAALKVLADPGEFAKKYNTEKPVLLFAVGDGNHSLATAKTCYENLKKTDPDAKNSPARYALAELVNLHDESLDFEAIHRIFTGISKQDFLRELAAWQGSKAGSHRFTLVSDGEEELEIAASHELCVGSVQNFLDSLAKRYPDFKIDYIHGEAEVARMAGEGWMGILLPRPDKGDLFRSVIEDGALPRKTFSMGHADDKRFYLEARKITTTK